MFAPVSTPAASAEASLNSIHREHAAGLVLGLRMPGMNGLDLLRDLASTRSRIPVLILTAHANEEMRRCCLEAGAIAFLPKPFDKEALLSAVQTALGTQR